MSVAAISVLPFFGVVRVSGEDRTVFLHNQLSNDIANLPANHACYATYNTPKGRVLANMLVLNRGEDMVLIMAQDLTEAIIKRLSMYVLRNKVTLQSASNLGCAGQLPAHEQDPQVPANPVLLMPAPEHNGVWSCTLPHGGTLLIGEVDALPAFHEKSYLLWQSHEIQCGYAWINAATTETCVAQMLNQHLIGGIHFKKGCYPGQEIIARAQYRGQVKRGLVLLGTPVCLSDGNKLYDDADEEVGIIINQSPQAHGCLALAVIKYSAAEGSLHTDHNHELVLKYAFFATDQDQ